MRKKNWPLLTLMGIVIVAGGVFLFKKITILHLKNMDRPRAFRIWISPFEQFSMFYIHSIYKEPVIEEFEAKGGTIVLKGVRTKSPAVMEYYGFDDVREFHLMNKRVGAVFVIKRGMGEGQGLLVKERKIYLSEIADKGDRIQVRVESVPLGEYLISLVF